jgi:hypothetical protein
MIISTFTYPEQLPIPGTSTHQPQASGLVKGNVQP